MNKPKMYISETTMKEWDLALFQSIAEQYDIVTTTEGAAELQRKESEAEFIEGLKRMAEIILPKNKIKSSKGKYPTNKQPKKKKR